MLTRRQHDLLLYIRDHLSETGMCPSYTEMMIALNLKSKSGSHRLVTALEDRGFIRRLPNQARSVEILRLPDDISQATQAENQSSSEETLQIPLYGKISAGTPIEALSGDHGHIPVPFGLIGKGDHYALTIEGDSMIGVGIIDGDTALIQRRELIENGQIGVALIDNEQATLKRVSHQDGKVHLQPENASYKTKVYDAQRVQIQGKLVGLLRRY